jgi:hypothetical protein
MLGEWAIPAGGHRANHIVFMHRLKEVKEIARGITALFYHLMLVNELNKRPEGLS